PRAQDLAAADAFHPGAKAVRPLAPDDRRLVGALHDLFPFEKSLTLERFTHRPVKIIRADRGGYVGGERVQCSSSRAPLGARYFLVLPSRTHYPPCPRPYSGRPVWNRS